MLHNRPVTVLMHIDERSRVRRIAGIDDSKLSIIPLGRFDSYLRAYDVLAARRPGRRPRRSQRERRPRWRAASSADRLRFPIGPHALAARAGATVLMGFGLYEGGARYRIEFVEFGPAAPAGSRGAALQPVVDRYVAMLESYARRYPKNWFNFFPYWEQR